MKERTVGEKRIAELAALGLKTNGREYYLDDINVHWTEIVCDTAEEWAEKTERIAAEIQRRKEKDSAENPIHRA